MASMTTDKNGNRAIEFVSPEGTRKRLKLGKMPKADVESIKSKIEHILSRKLAQREPSDEVSKWIGGLNHTFAKRLAALGLIPARDAAPETTLAAFLDDCFSKRTDAKQSTHTTWQRVRRHLVTYFGTEKRLTDFTPGNADEWRLYLKTEPSWKLRGAAEPEDKQKREKCGLAENTINRHIGIARQFFKVAVRKRIIAENPFQDLNASVKGNPSRFYFITREETDKLLNHCPAGHLGIEWQLIIALARYGGVRTPSETLALTWDDVNLEAQRITVHSPKTEHHAGHEHRIIPIFPELRPYLDAAYHLAASGPAVPVITRYRDAKQNLRTHFERIINKAGLKPWPKLFQNLRSSRETELAEAFPIQVVVAWLGNTEEVAKRHYLQVTDDHFTRAVNATPEGGRKGGRNNQEETGNTGNANLPPNPDTLVFPALSNYCPALPSVQWAAQDSNESPVDQGFSSESMVGGAKKGVPEKQPSHVTENREADPDFLELVELWNTLRPDGRKDLLKLLRNLAPRPHSPAPR